MNPQWGLVVFTKGQISQEILKISIPTVMYALCVVYNPSNPHLALGPVCTLVADYACCAPIYMHEHWTVLNTDRNSNIVTLLFRTCTGSCYAKIWRIKTILHPPFPSSTSQPGCALSYYSDLTMSQSWWRHQMETFFALLALCEGNSPVNGGFSSQSPVTRSFDISFDLCLSKRLSKQLRRRWLESHRADYEVTVMLSAKGNATFKESSTPIG